MVHTCQLTHLFSAPGIILVQHISLANLPKSHNNMKNNIKKIMAHHLLISGTTVLKLS